MNTYDVCVIGAGPGGISAAIRASQRGGSVCLVEGGDLGGTCLNRGCIPARALGTTAKLVAQLKNGQLLGVRSEGGFRVDLAQVVDRKNRILRRLRAGLSDLIARSKITWLQGEGVLQSAQELEVRFPGRPALGIRAKAVILATGSTPGTLPRCPLNGRTVITSDEILQLGELPSSLVVIGAGVVGSEFSSYFADLGVKVTLVEAADRVLPTEEERISEAFAQSLLRRGVTIFIGSKVEKVELQSSGIPQVTLQGGKTLEGSLVLMAAGRMPVVPKGAKELGLKLSNGFVEVDESLRTNVGSLYAVGDLLGEYQLACTASYEGAVAAENAMGFREKVQYDAVPDAIYTEPEIASVGLTEGEALARGFKVKRSSLSLTGFARAQTFEETEGFVQVVAEEPGGKILGVQMIGARATDLIGEATLAVKQGLTLKDLVSTLHGHPTMSESLWEAAAMALGQSIYYSQGAK